VEFETIFGHPVVETPEVSDGTGCGTAAVEDITRRQAMATNREIAGERRDNPSAAKQLLIESA
jgi:hypothetical protein